MLSNKILIDDTNKSFILYPLSFIVKGFPWPCRTIKCNPQFVILL